MTLFVSCVEAVTKNDLCSARAVRHEESAVRHEDVTKSRLFVTKGSIGPAICHEQPAVPLEEQSPGQVILTKRVLCIPGIGFDGLTTIISTATFLVLHPASPVAW